VAQMIYMTQNLGKSLTKHFKNNKKRQQIKGGLKKKGRRRE